MQCKYLLVFGTYVHVCAGICMYVPVSVGMCMYLINVTSPAQKVMACRAGVSVQRNKLSKRHANHSKTALTLLELEHPSSGAQMTLYTTEPSGLTKIKK